MFKEQTEYMHNDQNYYTVSRDEEPFTPWTDNGKYKKALTDMTVLINNKVCAAKDNSQSLCEISTRVTDYNTYYSVTRNGQRYSRESEDDLNSALIIREELVAAGLCVIPGPVGLPSSSFF